MNVIRFAGAALAGLLEVGLVRLKGPAKKVTQSSEDVEALQRAEAKRARKRAKLVSQGLGRLAVLVGLLQVIGCKGAEEQQPAPPVVDVRSAHETLFRREVEKLFAAGAGWAVTGLQCGPFTPLGRRCSAVVTRLEGWSNKRVTLIATGGTDGSPDGTWVDGPSGVLEPRYVAAHDAAAAMAVQ